MWNGIKAVDFLVIEGQISPSSAARFTAARRLVMLSLL